MKRYTDTIILLVPPQVYSQSLVLSVEPRAPACLCSLIPIPDQRKAQGPKVQGEGVLFHFLVPCCPGSTYGLEKQSKGVLEERVTRQK